ncbi:putative multi-domain containing protein, partial [Aduncisulcus paluster]
AQLPIVNPLTPDRVSVAGLPGATPPAPEAPQAPCMFFCAPQPPPAEPFNPFAPPPPPAEPFNPFAPNQAPQPFNPFAPPPPPTRVVTSELTTAVRSALAGVIDPELRRPITELGMVKDITFDDAHNVEIGIYLTTSGCPKKAEISERVSQAAADVDGVGTVRVQLDVMNDEQRTELRKQLRGDNPEPVIPFAQPGSLTRVYAVASGKGGVGKSSVTVNLAAAMA